MNNLQINEGLNIINKTEIYINKNEIKLKSVESGDRFRVYYNFKCNSKSYYNSQVKEFVKHLLFGINN